MTSNATFNDRFRNVFSALLTVLLLNSLCQVAHAGDRPFLAIDSAAAEEDDDNVWSGSVWGFKQKGSRGGSLAVEYTFNPQTSIQFEAARSRAKGLGVATTTVGEIELKYLFNRIARDDWGLGLIVALDRSQVRLDGERARGTSVTVGLPFTWMVSTESNTQVHLNAGLEKPRREGLERHVGVGVQSDVGKRVTLFAETAKLGGERLANAGVRWWIKREKWAVDLSHFRLRDDADGRSRGWVLGLSAYDF